MRNREAAKYGGVMPAQSGHGGSAMGKEVKDLRPNVRTFRLFSILLKIAKKRKFIQVCVPENRTQNRKSGGAPIAVLKSAFWDTPI